MTKTVRGEDTVQIGVRLPKAIHKTIVQMAKDERRSMNEEIIWLLEKVLAQKK